MDSRIQSLPASDARFQVLRVPSDTMPEGRIQFVQQRTPELLWQRRWLDHPNRAFALAAVLICVADPREAAQTEPPDRPIRA